MNNIEAIIFDMDGVLLDTETICDRAWEIVGKEQHIENYKEAISMCRGCNKTDSQAILKKFYGQDFDAKFFLQQSSYYSHKIADEEGIPLMPYVKEILEYLSKKYVLALASSTREEIVKKELADAGLTHYFKTFTCGDMVVHSKPDPEIYLMACNSIGKNPENCAAVEDSPNGIKSAFSAGLKTIMVPDKVQPDSQLKQKVHYLCKTLEDLKAFL